MNNTTEYEKRQADKQMYYKKRAEQLCKESENVYIKGRAIAAKIPFGQPILVGHHSEKRHLNDINKIEVCMNNSQKLQEKADYYQYKSTHMSTAISGYDSKALDKLNAKLECLEKRRELMKEVNKEYKKHYKKALNLLSKKEREDIINMFERKLLSDKPFPGFKLTNISANIRSVKQRIAKIERIKTRTLTETRMGNGFSIHETREDNSISIIFKEKPNAQIRSILKSHGFNWSPTRKIWIRMLNNQGINAANSVFNLLNQ